MLAQCWIPQHFFLVFVVNLLGDVAREPCHNKKTVVVGTVKNERLQQNSNIFRLTATIAVLLRPIENFGCYNLCDQVSGSDIGVSLRTLKNVVPKFRGVGYDNVFKSWRADWVVAENSLPDRDALGQERPRDIFFHRLCARSLSIPKTIFVTGIECMDNLLCIGDNSDTLIF